MHEIAEIDDLEKNKRKEKRRYQIFLNPPQDGKVARKERTKGQMERIR